MALNTVRRAGVNQSSRGVVYISARNFQPRPAYENHPPISLNPSFNVENLQPMRDMDERVNGPKTYPDTEIKGYTRNDGLWHHYAPQCDWKQGMHIGHSGFFGPYWPAHLGFQHHFIKRRTTTPGNYDHIKKPWWKIYHRFLDNRGVDAAWRTGTFHHIFLRWLVSIFIVVSCITNVIWPLKNHFALKTTPEEPKPEGDIEFNRALLYHATRGTPVIPGEY